MSHNRRRTRHGDGSARGRKHCAGGDIPEPGEGAAAEQSEVTQVHVDAARVHALSAEEDSVPLMQVAVFEHQPQERDDAAQRKQDDRESHVVGDEGGVLEVVGVGGVAGDVVEDGGEGGPGGVESWHGLLPLEQTTLQTRDVLEEEAPGFEMEVVNCGD